MRSRSVMLSFGFLLVCNQALADPITILRNGSGVSLLAQVQEGAVIDRQAQPFMQAENIDLTRSASVGNSAAVATVSLASDASTPASLSGSASVAANYRTSNGTADVSSVADFFVEFELASPHSFTFLGFFDGSGGPSDGPTQSVRGGWTTQLGVVGSQSHIFNDDGESPGTMFHTGILNAGVYRFLVSAGAFGRLFVPTAGAMSEQYGSFDFTFDLEALPPDTAVTPEPGSMLLLGTGLAGMIGAIRRRRTLLTRS
jgi:hypothetical protein